MMDQQLPLFCKKYVSVVGLVVQFLMSLFSHIQIFNCWTAPVLQVELSNYWRNASRFHLFSFRFCSKDLRSWLDYLMEYNVHRTSYNVVIVLPFFSTPPTFSIDPSRHPWPSSSLQFTWRSVLVPLSWWITDQSWLAFYCTPLDHVTMTPECLRKSCSRATCCFSPLLDHNVWL